MPTPEPLPEVFRVRFASLEEQFLGAPVRATDRLSVTGEISVRSVKPVPLETPILGRGRLTTRHDRYVEVEGSLEELATSEVLARARGRFFFQDQFQVQGTRDAPRAPEP